MQKRAPTLGNIFVIILFALSCFGLLLFLWDSFGGPLPLKPKGYRMEIAFPRVLALAEQSDVRISGVNVGHVISVKKGEEGKTIATVEINQKYAPVRRNVQAIIRQKTLLGETYIQLIPHSHTGLYVADNGRLPPQNVLPSVTLDDILATFDPKTRAAFKIWQQSVAEGINGRGEQINASFAQLEPFSENANKLLSILVTQEGALRDLIKNTGVVFNALGSRDHQLEGLIVNGEHTFKAAASASQAWAETWRLLPSFERNSTKALQELDKFSTVANPFLEEFRPAERSLSSLLSAAKPFAPELDRFLTALGPLTTAAKKGLPDLGKSLDLTVPILENFRPILHNLDPFLQYTGSYVKEVQSFFSNITAATTFQQGNANIEAGQGPKQHMLMTLATLNPESLASYGTQVGSQRANAYPLPGNYNQIGSGLPVFSTTSCGNATPSVNGPPSEVISEALILRLINLKVANRPETFTGFAPKEKAEKEELEKAEKLPAGTNNVPAPPCRQQGLNTFNGRSSQFPHVIFEGNK